MATRIGKHTIRLDHPPCLSAYASVVGPMEDQGPLHGCFDVVAEDARFGQKSWELAEARMQRTALDTAVRKLGLHVSDLELLLAGDLLNQCVGSSLAAATSGVPFLGLYGACSTMAEGLALGACLFDAGAAHTLAAAASSHFCSAERQYRFPLAYGGQRTPTAQWTATAAGAAVLSERPSAARITHVHFGRIVEMGVKDANNMGAAMAPAACDTLSSLLHDTNTTAADYDRILTGDLAKIGADLLLQLLRREEIDLTPCYGDCGILLYGDDQDVHAGGSGCGCSAAVLCSDVLGRMERGEWKRVIFAGTGALMSPTSVQQGQPIAGVCHAVILETEG